MFTEMFPAEPGADALLYDTARDFMTGVALQGLFPHGERPASDYLDALKGVIWLARLQI